MTEHAAYHQTDPRAKNRKMAMYLVAVIMGMFALTAASVPLYQIFCAVTGYGGTTGVANAAPGAVNGLPNVEVVFKVRKDSKLKWRVQPNQRNVVVRPGEDTPVSYSAENLLPLVTKGTSVFNVTPQKAGKYFSKIQCFCFEEQTLTANEQVDMDLVFFVDPAMFDDPDTRDLRQITLNYTFYPVD